METILFICSLSLLHWRMRIQVDKWGWKNIQLPTRNVIIVLCTNKKVKLGKKELSSQIFLSIPPCPPSCRRKYWSLSDFYTRPGKAVILGSSCRILARKCCHPGCAQHFQRRKLVLISGRLSFPTSPLMMLGLSPVPRARPGIRAYLKNIEELHFWT